MTTKKIESKIAKLRQQLEELEQQKQKPVGFNVVIQSPKGKRIHTFRTVPTMNEALALRSQMLKLMVNKMRQKVSFQIKPKFKSA